VSGTPYRPFTVEHLAATAERARAEGYEELADVFEGIGLEARHVQRGLRVHGRGGPAEARRRSSGSCSNSARTTRCPRADRPVDNAGRAVVTRPRGALELASLRLKDALGAARRDLERDGSPLPRETWDEIDRRLDDMIGLLPRETHRRG
jgi:hypothetical protein